jgi:hypothetical protein
MKRVESLGSARRFFSIQSAAYIRSSIPSSVLTVTGGAAPYSLSNDGMPNGSSVAIAGSTITVKKT